MKQINNAYMAELSEKEMKENNGGFALIPWIVKAAYVVAVDVVIDVVSNPKEHWNAFKEGFREGQK